MHTALRPAVKCPSNLLPLVPGVLSPVLKDAKQGLLLWRTATRVQDPHADCVGLVRFLILPLILSSLSLGLSSFQTGIREAKSQGVIDRSRPHLLCALAPCAEAVFQLPNAWIHFQMWLRLWLWQSDAAATRSPFCVHPAAIRITGETRLLGDRKHNPTKSDVHLLGKNDHTDTPMHQMFIATAALRHWPGVPRLTRRPSLLLPEAGNWQ